jgi:Cu-processing system permease protein
VVFLFLFWVANHYVFTQLSQITPPENVNVDTRTFAGACLFGLALCATMFLGVELAVFLTLGVVSGDAERGLLQPLVVRPVGRSTLLLARFLGAAGVCVTYVLAGYFAAMAITGLTGHWWPDRIVWPGVELAGAVLIVIALSLLGSVVLTSTANGIAVFMLFGAGLVAGLLGTIGHALNSAAVKHASTIAAWALPFEALYQDALRMITANASGLTGFLLQLGPFGGAYVHGWGIRVWAAGYLVAVLAIAVAAFQRRNLKILLANDPPPSTRSTSPVSRARSPRSEVTTQSGRSASSATRTISSSA